MSDLSFRLKSLDRPPYRKCECGRGMITSIGLSTCNECAVERAELEDDMCLGPIDILGVAEDLPDQDASFCSECGKLPPVDEDSDLCKECRKHPLPRPGVAGFNRHCNDAKKKK